MFAGGRGVVAGGRGGVASGRGGCCCCLAPPAAPPAPSWSAEAASASALRRTPLYLGVGFP